MNYDTLEKEALISLVEKLEKKQEEGNKVFEKKIESLQKELIEKEALIFEKKEYIDSVESKLASLHGMFSMLIYSLYHLHESTYNGGLTREQDRILSEANTFRLLLMDGTNM